MNKITRLILAAALALLGVVPAVAAGEAGDAEAPAGVVDANISYHLAHNPEILLAAGETGDEEGTTEEFVFGENETQDKVIKTVEMPRFQDYSGKASRDVKRIIGWTLITTGLMSAVWATFFHEDVGYPADYYTDPEKYEELGNVPLVYTKAVNVPSLVAGLGLAGGGAYLMTKK